MADTQDLAPLVFENDMHKMQHEMFVNMINERNSLVSQVNASKGDRQTLTEDIRENSTDPEIVEAREAWAQAYENLMALVTPKVEAIIEGGAGSTAEAEAQIAELDKTLKPGITFYKKVFGEDAAKHLPSQSRLAGGLRISGTGGGKRIRGYNVVVTIDDESEEFEAVSKAAQYLDATTADLQQKFFEKAGTNVLKDCPNEVTFSYDVVEVDEDDNETQKVAIVRCYRTEPVVAEAAPAAATADAAADAAADDVDLESI